MTCAIVTKRDACGDVAIECSACYTNRLTKRVDCFVTRAGLCGTRSVTLAGAVICHARSAVDCPHLVGSRCHNLSIMHAWSIGDNLRRFGASKSLSRHNLASTSRTSGELHSTILISSSTYASAKHFFGPRLFFGVAPCNASTTCR